MGGGGPKKKPMGPVSQALIIAFSGRATVKVTARPLGCCPVQKSSGAFLGGRFGADAGAGLPVPGLNGVKMQASIRALSRSSTSGALQLSRYQYFTTPFFLSPAETNEAFSKAIDGTRR